MDTIFQHTINELLRKDKTLQIEEIAESYLLQKTEIIEDSIEFFSALNKAEKKIITCIKKINRQFIQDDLEEPIILNSSGKFIKKSNSFQQLLDIFYLKVVNNPNLFAEKVGTALLRKLGCKEEDCYITPISNDKGIDYWGVQRLPHIISSPAHSILIVGQVKKYSGNVPVEDLRAFLGSVQIALSTNYFGEAYNLNTPIILQFVTTGELSEEGRKAAATCKIHVITKRHLSNMKLL
ncbi:Restriction endonuclease [Priestia megaterium]|uniref:restriction endonuclease n=1 Tax=Priestia megaterium TaxID=1404 RepID=UPI000E13AC7D|nr:restriction endonuclease [Priestia megaterium]SUV06403.1 Restriction endonuclease [Priestia megaterium]